MSKITLCCCLLLSSRPLRRPPVRRTRQKRLRQQRPPSLQCTTIISNSLFRKLAPTASLPTAGVTRPLSAPIETSNSAPFVPAYESRLSPARPGATGNDDLEIQYQYLDVGVNIDTRNVHEIGRQLAVQLKAEVSSLADSAPSFVSKLPNDPVIRQNMWQASVIIPVGKPTVVFSSDAFDSKGSMQLVVSATPLQ